MSRLMKLQRRLEFNDRNVSTNCQAVVCPDGPPDADLNEVFAVSWDCVNCMMLSKERYDRFMEDLKCLA